MALVSVVVSRVGPAIKVGGVPSVLSATHFFSAVSANPALQALHSSTLLVPVGVPSTGVPFSQVYTAVSVVRISSVGEIFSGIAGGILQDGVEIVAGTLGEPGKRYLYGVGATIYYCSGRTSGHHCAGWGISGGVVN